MAVESKPLFHPEVQRQQERSFDPPKYLAVDVTVLKGFAFLLEAEWVVPGHRECHFHKLLCASETVWRALTN